MRKPCPFCGSTDLHVLRFRSGSTIRVTCGNCNCEGPLEQPCDDECSLWEKRADKYVVAGYEINQQRGTQAGSHLTLLYDLQLTTFRSGATDGTLGMQMLINAIQVRSIEDELAIDLFGGSNRIFIQGSRGDLVSFLEQLTDQVRGFMPKGGATDGRRLDSDANEHTD